MRAATSVGPMDSRGCDAEVVGGVVRPGSPGLFARGVVENCAGCGEEHLVGIKVSEDPIDMGSTRWGSGTSPFFRRSWDSDHEGVDVDEMMRRVGAD